MDLDARAGATNGMSQQPLETLARLQVMKGQQNKKCSRLGPVFVKMVLSVCLAPFRNGRLLLLGTLFVDAVIDRHTCAT